MKNRLIITCLISLVLGGCFEKEDTVPAVEDPHNIIIDGRLIKPRDFLVKYACEAKPENETCLKVSQAARYDATHGPMPAGYGK